MLEPPEEEKKPPKRDSKGRFVSKPKEELAFLVKEEIDLPDTARSRDYSSHPVRPLDERIVVWELKRPLVEKLPDIPISKELLESAIKDPTQSFEGSEVELEEAKAFCMEQLDTGVMPGNPEEVAASIKRWLQVLKPAFVVGLYHDLNEFLVDRNGFVTETNKLIANATGSSTNAILLGNTQQSRASLFYISSYITKNKMALEHCLSALSRAQAHIEKYPSKAEDAGTKKRTIQHLMQRVLNTMYCHREVSDTQVALALLNGLGAEATSDSFSYYGAGYMNNFVDAELKANCEVKDCNDVPLVDDVECADEDQDAGDVDLVDSMVECPTDCWGSIRTSKTTELGPAPFYRTMQLIDGELKAQSVPVHYPVHWRYRGEGLAMMTPAEYYATTKVVPLPKNKECLSTADQDDYDNEDLFDIDCSIECGEEEQSGENSTGSRLPNKRFRFAKEHPLYHTHCQCLRSKQVTLIHNGFTPKYPGPKPERPETNGEAYERHYRVWKRKADAFAKYYLCTFRPLEGVYSGDQKISHPEDFT